MVLNQVKHPADLLIRELAAERGHDMLKCFFPGVFPEDEMPLSPNKVWGEIFIGRRIFKNSGNMDAALMRERELPGDRLVSWQCNAGIFFDHVREPVELAEIVPVDTFLHTQDNEKFL